jgi:tRNA (cytidine/uridine-2'-O-)-methyltransferase
MLHLALYQPSIPQNTGNIARTTVGFGAQLHLIHPMKFEITDHAVKRAGLDYWPSVRLTEHANDEAFLDWLASPSGGGGGGRRPWLITKFGKHRFDQPDYRDGDVILLGNENTGLPQAWHDRWSDRTVYIPMPGPGNGLANIRSFNLANAAAIVMAHATLHISDVAEQHAAG